MGGKWLYSYYFVARRHQNFSKQYVAFIGSSHLAFSQRVFAKVLRVQPYNNTDTAWKNSRFILSERSDYHTIDCLLIAVHIFLTRIWTLPSVDEILLPMYMDWSTDFRGLLLKSKCLCRSMKTGATKCKNLLENVTNEFVLLFLSNDLHFLPVLFGWVVRWELSGCTTAVF